MTDITLICLSLLIAILTMMVAAEMGQRRRSRH
jgi:NO-binding membrane sensor protein with MHYT domain